MPVHSGKRQKTTAEKAPGLVEEHTEFTKASRKRGIEINGVHAARIPGAGLGLRTTRAIQKDERLMFIPASAMFKPDQKFLVKHGLQRTASPQAHLAITALARFSDSSDEFLELWQTTWPTERDYVESMPMCWPASLQELLVPAVHFPLKRLVDDFEKDWAVVKEFCSSQGWDRERFQYYWMAVNSRSFHWKPSASTVTKNSRRSITARPEPPGLMVMCPFLDLMNHGPSSTTVTVYQRADGYEVLANRAYKAGEEIHATYGAHPNDRLLVHYGFVLDQNQNTDDDVRLDHVLLPALTASVKEQLQDVGFLGGYALLPTTNEVCFKTQVAVRAMLLSSNEWEYFVQNGEDLGEDRRVDVKKFLLPLLRSFHDQAKQRIEEISKLHEFASKDTKGDKANLTALTIMLAHWRQTSAALGAYFKSK